MASSIVPETFNFVLCPSFHGATMFSLLLNNHRDVSSLGDTIPITEYVQTCGCSREVRVNECSFWQMIESRFGEYRCQKPMPWIYPKIPVLDSSSPKKNTALVRAASLAALFMTRRVWGEAGKRFSAFYQDFANTVNEYNGTSVYVNGGKNIDTPLAVKSILGNRAKIRIIHLIRDPRAFYCADKPNYPLARSVARWRRYHNRVSTIIRRLCNAEVLEVRYEDLCQNPEQKMAEVFRFLGVPNQNVFHKPMPHHFMGHITMHKFDGSLRQSTRWHRELSADEAEECLRRAGRLARIWGYVGPRTLRRIERSLPVRGSELTDEQWSDLRERYFDAGGTKDGWYIHIQDNVTEL